MKRFIFVISALCVAFSAAAQVSREVEVTKQYVPKLPPARKLDMVIDKQDTVSIRPEIDYTITPNSFTSALTTNKFRPATVTYWDYEKRYPFYVKAGVGYPLASELDVYASTNRADVGYLSGYVNHRGRFSNIKDSYELSPGVPFEFDNNSQQMSNRIGFNGGKYIGRYTLDADIFYQTNIFHRYPQQVDENTADEVNYEDIAVAVNFGDSFADMSKLNFSVYASADYYNDKSEHLLLPEQSRKLQQMNTALGLKFGRNIAQRASLFFTLGYRGYYGLKSIDVYSDNVVSATLMFNYHTKKMFDIKAGLTYSYDHLPSVAQSKKNHIFPHIYFGADLFENGSLVPYVEVDGELTNNSYQQLQQINPYVALPMDSVKALPNTQTYNVRIGISGHVFGDKLSYRLYGNGAFMDNALYWYSSQPAYFDAVVAKQQVWSINAALEYKPLSVLYFSAKAKGMVYSCPEDVKVANCKPSFEGEFNARYTHRKFAIGATAQLVGKRSWTIGLDSDMPNLATYDYPAYVDLGVVFDWFVGKQCTIYVEGRNLTNAKIYHWALYKEYGVGALAGIKVQF